MNKTIKQNILFAFSFLIYIPTFVFAAGLENPLQVGSLSDFVQKFLESVVYIGFPVAVLFVVYSGFRFVLAQGNASELEKAKKNFTWTVIGVGMFLGAWALAELIRGTINQLR